MENENEAVISIYRLGETEGTFSKNSDGTYSYVSYDGNVKGEIRLNEWDNATFEVKEIKNSQFTVGEFFAFGFAF